MMFATIAAASALYLQGGEVVLFDDFDDGMIGKEWSVAFQDAEGWTAIELDSELAVEDIDPTVVNEFSFGPWAIVSLRQDFAPLGSFNSTLALSWDSEGSDDAMQFALLRFLDWAGETVVVAGYADGWVNEFGQYQAEIDGVLFNSGANTLPGSGSAQLGIVRECDGEIIVSWDGEPIHSGFANRAIVGLAIEFWYYAYDGNGGVSFFGQEAVDWVEVSGFRLADLTGDCVVGTGDLLVLLGMWGPCADCINCIADLDGDCSVGTTDLLILLGSWG